MNMRVSEDMLPQSRRDDLFGFLSIA